VLLVDTADFFIVRMWKGYREAQVAWTQIECREAPEEGSATLPHHAIVIYAPRRQLLEVWALRHGPRLAAVNLRRACRLLPATLPLAAAGAVAGEAPAVGDRPLVACHLLMANGAVMRLHVFSKGEGETGCEVSLAAASAAT